MRRVWVLLLAAAQAGAQEFSEAELDRAIREIGRGEIEYVRKVGAWGPAARRAVPALVAAWRVPGRTFEDAVDAALRAMGPYAFPEVVKALGGRDGPVRWSAEDFLEARSREAPSVPLDPGLDGAFLDLLDHKDPRARAAVARALATRGGAVVPKLVPLLGTGSPGRRHAAAFALSWIEPPPEDARAALLAATSDKDAAVRAQALAAVARLKSSGSEILRCLLAALKDRADGVVAAAVAGLVGR
ncbi:MAG: HEAT repeat domain-containing protein, partial [Planctomycetes bacterium]|nr:HEAT repeat domain-containing protein [Planctomycetota bacterium]